MPNYQREIGSKSPAAGKQGGRSRTPKGDGNPKAKGTSMDDVTKDAHKIVHLPGDPEGELNDEGLTSAEAELLLQKWGRNELPEKKKGKFELLMEQFLQPMPLMITAAFCIEGMLQNWVDMTLLIVLNIVNCGLAYYEASKAADAIAALKSSLKPQAQVKRDGHWQNIDAKFLVPTDCVALNAGAAVPADCKIISGNVDIDQAALTGESLPVTMQGGGEPKMGSTVTRGEVSAVVMYTGAHTFFGKTAMLIQAASDSESNMQKILFSIMISLCALSLLLCSIAFAYLLMVLGEDFKESLSFTVVLLVASIPMAMEVVTTTVMALGSRKLAKKDAIVAKLSAIEEMAGMNMLCSDKTGTLTTNKMELQDECPTYVQGHDQASVVLNAALAAKWWEPPKDALDTLVLGAADLDMLNEKWESIEEDYIPFDPSRKRTEAHVKSKTGKARDFNVVKGAPHIVMDMCKGNSDVKERFDADVHAFAERGIRCLAVATDEGGKGLRMLGVLTFLDPPRPDTKYTLDMAKKFGIHIKMITGDHMLIGKEMMRVLGQGTQMHSASALPKVEDDGSIDPTHFETYKDVVINADGFGEVYPEHKYFIVELLRNNGYRVGMTGDGVNDAPALKRSDVGIAVQGATDAACAAADIVLTKPGLSVLVDAIIIARTIFQRMKNYLVYRVACTIQLLLFFFIALIFFHPRAYCPEGESCALKAADIFRAPARRLDETVEFVEVEEEGLPSYFFLPVLALVIITILNDGTLITVAYDNVVPGKLPEVWDLPMLYLVASALGLAALFSSILLLHMGLSAVGSDDAMLAGMFGRLSFQHVQAMIYLKVSVSDFLTLFSSRTPRFFWGVFPNKMLAGAGVFALLTSTLLACTWPFRASPEEAMEPLPIGLALFVWAFCIFFFFIQDLVKVLINVHIVEAQKKISEGKYALLPVEDMELDANGDLVDDERV